MGEEQKTSFGTFSDLPVKNMTGSRGPSKTKKVPEPTSTGLDLPDLSGIRSEEDMIAEAEAVKEYLDRIRPTIKKIFGVCRTRPGSKEADKASATMERMLAVEDRGIRTITEWQYAAELVADVIEHGGADIWTVTRNLGVGKEPRVRVLKESDGKFSGTFRFVLGKTMLVPATFTDDLKEVVSEVFRGLHALEKVSRERATVENEARRKKFLEGVSRSWSDLLNTSPGLYVVSIPEGKYIPKHGLHAGEERTLYGGLLKVEIKIKGRILKPIGAFGRFERSMEELINCGLTIPLGSIAEERIYLDPRSRREMSDHEVGMMFSLHATMRRGYLAYVETEEKRQEAQLAAEKATVGHEEWLSGKAGVGFISHFTFSRKDHTYRHPWTLVERAGGKIRLLETNVPDLFVGVGSDWMDEGGEDFVGLKDPLRAFLRLAANKVARKAEEPELQEAEVDLSGGAQPERREILVEG